LRKKIYVTRTGDGSRKQDFHEVDAQVHETGFADYRRVVAAETQRKRAEDNLRNPASAQREIYGLDKKLSS